MQWRAAANAALAMALALIVAGCGRNSTPTPGGSKAATCQLDICEYAPPTADSAPGTIIPGPDGAMWFTENNANKIARITLDGVITEYESPLPRAAR